MTIKATEKWIGSIIDAMKLLDGLDMPPDVRIVLRRVCVESLVEAEDRQQFDYEHRNGGKPFSKDELTSFKAALEEAPICTQWEDERLILGRLCLLFGRPEKPLKKKAIELGYQPKVDYWNQRDRSKD